MMGNRISDTGRKATPPSGKRLMDQAQRALVRCSATAKITIPIATDDQNIQLKWNAFHARGAVSSFITIRTKTTRPSSPSASPIRLGSAEGPAIRSGRLEGYESL